MGGVSKRGSNELTLTFGTAVWAGEIRSARAAICRGVQRQTRPSVLTGHTEVDSEQDDAYSKQDTLKWTVSRTMRTVNRTQ